jgi:hypothetical protein
MHMIALSLAPLALLASVDFDEDKMPAAEVKATELAETEGEAETKAEAEAEAEAKAEKKAAEKAAKKTKKVCRRIRADASSRQKKRVCLTTEQWREYNNRR